MSVVIIGCCELLFVAFLVTIFGALWPLSLFICENVVAAAVTAAVAFAIATLFEVPLDRMFLTKLFIVFELDEPAAELCRLIFEPTTLTLRGFGIFSVPILTCSAFWMLGVLLRENALMTGPSDGRTVMPGLAVPAWAGFFVVSCARLRVVVVGDAGVLDLIMFFGPDNVSVDGTWVAVPAADEACDKWIWMLPLAFVAPVD